MARKKEAPAPAKIRLKKGDIVKVIVGPRQRQARAGSSKWIGITVRCWWKAA